MGPPMLRGPTAIHSYCLAITWAVQPFPSVLLHAHRTPNTVQDKVAAPLHETAHRNVCLRPCHDLCHELPPTRLDFLLGLPVVLLPQLVLLVLKLGEVHAWQQHSMQQRQLPCKASRLAGAVLRW